MKYGNLTLGQVEAIANKLGGEEGVKRFLAGELVVKEVEKSNLLRIDRSTPFDPEKFIGKGWKIVEGSEDERSLALAEIDLSKPNLVSILKPGEEWVMGDVNLARLKKSKVIRMDAKIFQTLWENKALIPSSWKEKVVFFDGTLLWSPSGGRYALDLFWYGRQWDWDYVWQGSGRLAVCASAVLAG